MDKLDKRTRDRVLTAIDDVMSNPRSGSQLVFAKEFLFKWRVGDYRIVYRIDEKRKIIVFVLVDHRRRVYARL